MPPKDARAIMVIRVSAGLSAYAVRAAMAISSGREPNWTVAIFGRATSSSPKNRASISLSAVQPAKWSMPV